MTMLFSLFLLAAPVGEITTGDIVRLTKAGAGDEVIIGHLRSQGATLRLSTDDIVALKKEGVSDRVLQFLLTPPERATASRGATLLLLSNQDESPYSVMVDEGSKKIYFYYGNLRDRVVLGKGESKEIPVAPGTYTVRWVGEPTAYALTVREGEAAKLIAGPIRFADYRAVNLSIFEGDREIAGGTLKVFEDRRTTAPMASNHAVQRATQPTVIYRYVNEPSTVYSRVEPPLISSNSLFWTGIGAATYRHRRWKGAAIGYAFGHLLDHLVGYRYTHR